jgi:ABC-type transporter Mla MlaB component
MSADQAVSQRLGESLTIDCVTTVRNDIFALLPNAGTFALDVSALQTVDLAGLQLLLALVRECDARSVAVRLDGPLLPAARESIARTCFAAETCPDGAALLAQLRIL